MTQPVYGRIKAGRAPFINSAGKYLVCGELRRRDVTAEPGPANDGRIVLPNCEAVTVRIKVKTSATRNGWVWMAQEGGTLFRELAQKDFTVLVDLGDNSQTVEYFVVQTREIERELRREHAEWLKAPPRRGRAHSRNNRMHRIGYDPMQLKWLEQYRSWQPVVAAIGMSQGRVQR